LTYIKVSNANFNINQTYINEFDKKLLNEINISLVYPYKKNQKTQNTNEELILLKKRIIVER
jgi:hypothetical protein